MIYILFIWFYILSMYVFMNIGKKSYKKQLKEKFKNNNDEQILDFVWNTFKK